MQTSKRRVNFIPNSLSIVMFQLELVCSIGLTHYLCVLFSTSITFKLIVDCIIERLHTIVKHIFYDQLLRMNAHSKCTSNINEHINC